MAKVGYNPLFCLDFFDNGHSLRDAAVGRVGFHLQTAGHDRMDLALPPFQQFFWQAFEICCVNKWPDLENAGGRVAMASRRHLNVDSKNVKSQSGYDFVKDHLWFGAVIGRVLESIGKAGLQIVKVLAGGVNENGNVALEEKRPQVIKSVAMIRVRVGVDDVFDVAHALADHLQAKFCRRVENNMLALGKSEHD